MRYKCDDCEAEFYDYEMAPCFDYDFPAGCCPDCGSAELDELIMADECRLEMDRLDSLYEEID